MNNTLKATVAQAKAKFDDARIVGLSDNAKVGVAVVGAAALVAIAPQVALGATMFRGVWGFCDDLKSWVK